MKRSEQELVRLEKLEAARKKSYPFPNDVKLNATSLILQEAEVKTPEDSERYSWAGRITQMRLMGKAAFVHVLDEFAKFQVYIKQDNVGEESFEVLKHLDIGDIIEVKGYVFITKTGEKTLHVDSFRLLSKSLIPLPEKWHGLTDVESRYRYRYVDLIANPEVREIFKKRAKIIREIRDFLDSRGYLEVETPVLQSITGGTTAKPFASYYNALGEDVYMRIAQELYLKKLIVGGFTKVYEIGRVFRNEGLSKKHNPEFTMLEFNEAYVTYEEMIDLTQELLQKICMSLYGELKIPHNEDQIDFSGKWPRYTMLNSIYEVGGLNKSFDLQTLAGVCDAAKSCKIHLNEPTDWGRSLEALFDELVQPKLKNPTFITQHPFSISPLAFRNREDDKVVDRFELFMGGMEVANAFSELNDPIDQRERFEAQADRKASGDDEAQDVDHDFLRAMEYGMPPNAGVGIGIDRLVMILTNSPNLREVLLFPQLKSLEEGEDEVAGEDVSVSTEK